VKLTIKLELEIGSEEGEKETTHVMYRPIEVWHDGQLLKTKVMDGLRLPISVMDNPKEPAKAITIVIMED
jgi:hypothetical protein